MHENPHSTTSGYGGRRRPTHQKRRHPYCRRSRRRPPGTKLLPPEPAICGVRQRHRLVGIADLGQLLVAYAADIQQLLIPLTGTPIEHSGPRRCRCPGRCHPQDLQVDVLTERHPVANATEAVWHRVAQPSQSRRQIACVEPASGALLDHPLVQLPSQFADLGCTPDRSRHM
jgi:hypothetical protein